MWNNSKLLYKIIWNDNQWAYLLARGKSLSMIKEVIPLAWLLASLPISNSTYQLGISNNGALLKKLFNLRSLPISNSSYQLGIANIGALLIFFFNVKNVLFKFLAQANELLLVVRTCKCAAIEKKNLMTLLKY